MVYCQEFKKDLWCILRAGKIWTFCFGNDFHGKAQGIPETQKYRKSKINPFTVYMKYYHAWGKKEMDYLDLDILSEKAVNKSICYLCNTTLEKYISNLPKDYSEYEIQRGIEKNTYLDSLIDTVLSGGHIPPIVLVADKENYDKNQNNSSNSLKIREFKILDGLQRTYRLRIIWDTIALFQKCFSEKGEELYSESRFSLSQKYSQELCEINSAPELLYTIIDFHKNHGSSDITSCFKNNEQWFEVWTDLSAKEQAHKMLVLNAGHKQVKAAHQIELLFLTLIPHLQKVSGKQLTLFREKEKPSSAYNKRRKSGQFHFSYVISAILSFIKAKPVATSIPSVLKLREEQFDTEKLSDFFDCIFYEEFITFLLALDEESVKEG
ncbi:MAG: hypothetical protein GY862_06435, partial [Gammaproteobacteria bacterium]|nr:hypothetical protein [Gammaproteobacteria bacterium]